MVRAIRVDDYNKFTRMLVLLREWFLDSLTLVPVLCLIGAGLLAWIMFNIETSILEQADTFASLFGSTASAISVTSVIASSMLSFLAVVFSVTLVALQLANQQFSPRVLRTFIRSTIVKVMLGLSTGTFAYALLILYFGIKTEDATTPFPTVSVAVLLVFVTTIFFVVFVKKILTMMRVGYIISMIANETHESIQDVFPPEEAYRQCPEVMLGKPYQVIHYAKGGRLSPLPREGQGVFLAVDNGHLVQLAQKQNGTIRVLPHTGEYIINGDPVLEVYGDAEMPPKECLSTFFVEPERSIQQDPAYGFRALVDIALQALSPAVNAPTTATQVIYRLTALLLAIARRPAPTGYYADKTNIVRLVRPTTDWEAYVDLAFEEIIEFGATSSQVRHTLQLSFEHLLEETPPDLHEPLQKQQQRLSATVAGVDSAVNGIEQRSSLETDKISAVFDEELEHDG
jgi:uncharacterized membrane protein